MGHFALHGETLRVDVFGLLTKQCHHLSKLCLVPCIKTKLWIIVTPHFTLRDRLK
jgi:hypothetical protein